MSDSNMFEDIISNSGAAEKYKSPSYPYYKYIKTPSEMGMSGQGSLSQLGTDIDGLKNYLQVLVSGGGNASATGQPLGNKYFLQTAAKCTDTASKKEVDRYIYINNVPKDNIPANSLGMGANFSEFKGLIPGTINNLNTFNPLLMFQSFMTGSEPDCQELTMDTIDTHNNRSTETNFVTLVDIKNIDPCSFENKINPLTKNKCRETFATRENSNIATTAGKYCPQDTGVKVYFTALGILGAYIVYKIMVINKVLPKQ